MQENELYQSWFSLAARGETLRSGSHRLQVLQSGEISLHRGPDIRHARFRLDGQIYSGAVEFHIKPQDWYGHNHHLDRAYENVLLHVVAQSPNSRCSVFHKGSGAEIPTLVMPVDSATGPATGLCPAKISPGQLFPVLAKLAQRRFQFKVRQFMKDFSVMPPDQIFYRATMRVWGYPHNAQAFELLAQRCPWSHIWSWLRRRGRDEQGLLGLLAGTAGFLMSVPDEYTSALSDRFKMLRQLYPVIPLTADQWVWAACRPVNHPHRRLAGMAALLSRQEKPFWKQAREVLYQRLPGKQALVRLSTLLSVRVCSYWQKHYALGEQARSLQPHVYFGQSRVLEWLSNVLLPAVSAQAALQGSEGFAAYLLQLWQDLPQPVCYGFIKNYSGIESLPSKNFVGQGFLQLRQDYCRASRCSDCPVCQVNRSLT